MKFKLHRTNMAPEGTEPKHWEVSIQVSECGSRHGAENILGQSCRTQAELDRVVNELVCDLKKLQFPE
jgi:hypothetical protein